MKPEPARHWLRGSSPAEPNETMVVKCSIHLQPPGVDGSKLSQQNPYQVSPYCRSRDAPLTDATPANQKARRSGTDSGNHEPLQGTVKLHVAVIM